MDNGNGHPRNGVHVPETHQVWSGSETGRVTAMRTFFAANSERIHDEMYSNLLRGTAERDRDSVVVAPHSTVSTNTYFGRFPAGYWQRWTARTSVRVRAAVSGRGRILLMASDSNGEPRIVGSTRVEKGEFGRAGKNDLGHVELTAAVDRFTDGGALWLELETAGSPLEVREVRWTVAAGSPRRPTDLVMCTHDRPSDCLSTLETLAHDAGALSHVDVVHVIDQGSDTVESQPGFPHVERLLGSKLHYLRQPNLGGAGGFTRGMLEATEGARQHDVLLLDDDILLEPDTVPRMIAFAAATVDPVIVGGQMLQLLHPKRLLVTAERARFASVEPGLPVPGSRDRVDLTEEQQDLRVDADYNAWWCCLLPAEIVAHAGYPLPVFFQWDDVEYGYRCRQLGYATVTLPGAAVWHADFDWKDTDEWVRYFTMRNALIINALRGEFPPAATATAALWWILRCLVSMRYAQAATLIKAVEDFLRGPEVLDDGGRQALAEVRALRAGYPESRRHPASDVPELTGSRRPMATAGAAPSMRRIVFVKRLLWQLLGRNGGCVSVPTSDALWWHVSLFDTAVVTDASQEGVRVRRFDRAKLLRTGLHGVRSWMRLRRRGTAVSRQWQREVPRLTSRENWTRLFGDRPCSVRPSEVGGERCEPSQDRAGSDETSLA